MATRTAVVVVASMTDRAAKPKRLSRRVLQNRGIIRAACSAWRMLADRPV